MSEGAPEQPPLDEWYGHLITPLAREELSGEEYERALAAVRTAMGGIERLIAEGRIRDVELSFTIADSVTPDAEEPPYGFNFSSPE